MLFLFSTEDEIFKSG